MSTLKGGSLRIEPEGGRIIMVCSHLSQLEEELIAAGVKETFRGEAWSRKCREWVYFDCVLDRDAIRQRIEFEACVKDHEHFGTHDGQEAGFICEKCQDGIMGIPASSGTDTKKVYR